MSTIEHVSDTALWVATYRAIESERPDALFKDPLAAVLTGERGRAIAKRLGYPSVMSWVMVVRTVAIDRLIEKALGLGVDCVINLGTGLDTRPYRLQLPPDLRWVEIDFAHLIDYKNEKLAGQTPVCRLERIACDLSNRADAQALYKRLGGECRKALVITEGVIPYLTNDQATALANDLFAVPSFEYWIQDYRDGGLGRRGPSRWQKKMAKSPFLFFAPRWIEFFENLRWTPEEVIYAADESKRIGRPVPFLFRLLGLITPKARRSALRKGSGYVMFKKAK